jgi:hypothetical protein
LRCAETGAREAGISGRTASQLKMPERVLKSLEDENWQRLGAGLRPRAAARLRQAVEGRRSYLQQAELQPIRPAELIS